MRFDRPGVELDPGGIGKGYAVDRMVDVLRQKGVTTGSGCGVRQQYLWNGRARPTSREAGGWRSRTRGTPDRTAAEVFLKDMSMSTSGSYEKFFGRKGRRTRTLWTRAPGIRRRAALSVSVVAPRTIDSEAWAKPYFVNGRQWAAQHKPKEFRVFFCEDRTDQPCAWLQ